MPLIQLVVILVVIAVLPWLVCDYRLMRVPVKRALTGVVAIALVLWLLSVFGPFSSFSNLRAGT